MSTRKKGKELMQHTGKKNHDTTPVASFRPLSAGG
jgi:hypothetical protein